MNKSKKGFLALSISVILAACTSTTPPLTATPAAGENQTQSVTETATIPLKIAAQVCEKATEPGIPPEGLPYRPTDVLLIGGETIEEGDFVFDFWLTCSPSEGTSQKDQPTTVEGLGCMEAGIMAAQKWRGLLRSTGGLRQMFSRPPDLPDRFIKPKAVFAPELPSPKMKSTNM